MFVEASTEGLGRRLRALGNIRRRLSIDRLPQAVSELLQELHRSLGLEQTWRFPFDGDEIVPGVLTTGLVAEVEQIETVFDLCRELDLGGIPVFVPDGEPKPPGSGRPLFDFTVPQPWLFDNEETVPLALGRAGLLDLIERSRFIDLVRDVDDAIDGVYSLFAASVELVAVSFRTTGGGGSGLIHFTLSTTSPQIAVEGTFQHRTHWVVLGRTDLAGSVSQHLGCGYWKFRKATPPTILDPGRHVVSSKRTHSATSLF